MKVPLSAPYFPLESLIRLSESLLSSLITRLAVVKTNGFKVLALEPDLKDGGVFVKFQYSGTESNDPGTLHKIESDLRSEAAQHGGLPTWLGSPGHGGSVWLVKGKPWKEVTSFAVFLNLPFLNIDSRTCTVTRLRT